MRFSLRVAAVVFAAASVIACSAAAAAKTETLLSSSNTKSNNADVQYVAIHLAMDEINSGRVVTWMTKSASSLQNKQQSSARPACQFALTASDITSGNANVSLASRHTYNASVGYIYDAILAVNDGKTYFYRVGDLATNKWSETSSFLAPHPEQASRPFTAIVYGDMGVRGSETTVARVNALVQARAGTSEPIDTFLHLGDIGYAGDYSSDQFEPVWARFFEQLQPAMTRVPYMVSVGNNDRGCKNDSVCKGVLKYSDDFENYKQLFHMPNYAATRNMWYSVDMGPIHLIAISTETGFPDAPWGNEDGGQLEWLEKDLIQANANRKTRPWIVVIGHRPIYSSIIIYNDIFSPIGFCRTLQERFEPLFHKYNVDIFFNGHIHGYERNYPTYNSESQKTYTNPSYTTHIMAGAAGDMEGNDPWFAYSHEPFMPGWLAYRYISPAWIEKYDYAHNGYGVARFANATTMSWEFYSSVSGHLVDSITLTRQR